MTDPNHAAVNPPPTIDPTKLTTEQLHREISAAMELLEAKIDRLEEVRDVKFDGVDREFANIEKHRVEQKVDTKAAVDAALAAAKEAIKEQTAAQEKSIIKSETSASEQSKLQYATFTESLKGIDTTVKDLKDRVVKIESQKQGATETRDSQRSDYGMLIAAGSFLVAIAAVAVAVIVALAS